MEKKWVHVVPQLCHNLTKEQPSPHILKNIYTPYTSSPSLSSSSVCFPFNFPHCNFQILSLVYACNSTSRVETGDPIAFIFITISFIFACLPAISDLKKKKKLCGTCVQLRPGCTLLSQTSPTWVQLPCRHTHAFLFQRQWLIQKKGYSKDRVWIFIKMLEVTLR